VLERGGSGGEAVAPLSRARGRERAEHLLSTAAIRSFRARAARCPGARAARRRGASLRAPRHLARRTRHGLVGSRRARAARDLRANRDPAGRTRSLPRPRSGLLVAARRAAHTRRCVLQRRWARHRSNPPAARGQSAHRRAFVHELTRRVEPLARLRQRWLQGTGRRHAALPRRGAPEAGGYRGLIAARRLPG
jgi:hypothetical protein